MIAAAPSATASAWKTVPSVNGTTFRSSGRETGDPENFSGATRKARKSTTVTATPPGASSASMRMSENWRVANRLRIVAAVASSVRGAPGLISIKLETSLLFTSPSVV